MKKTLLTMAAALVLVGCSKSELVETPIQEQNAIAFGTYLGDNAQTRASVVTTETLGEDGFGVNAYYTGQNNYANGAELNFMQNTKVTCNKDNQKWEYSPVKYWPNNADDKVSFFAYGPYAKSAGDNNITQNGTSLDFVVPAEVKNQVDLIYNTNYNGTIDQTKPSVEELIHFQFGHALSRISFTVEAAVDEVANGNNLLDGNTRINVKKVALVSNTDTEPLTPTGPFYTGGTLSLLNPGTADDGTPNSPWSNLTGSQGFVFNATNHFYHTVKDVDAENMTGDKIDIVQLTRFNASEPQRLLNDSSYLMVIPQIDAEFKIYIEYDVISGGYENNGTGTYDESAITNKITSAEALKVTFEQGKAYNFNLVLGMTSVKVDASVDEWGNEIDGGEVWLPENEEQTIQGLGTAESPYLIYTATQLKTAADKINEYSDEIPEGGEVRWPLASYKLMKDIDLSTVCSETLGTWIPIDRLEGGFDGNNYTIKNLYIYNGGKSDYNCGLGLFGDLELKNGGKIQNLNVEGSILVDEYVSCIGGIVGRFNYSKLDEGEAPASIENCTFKGTITTEFDGDNAPYKIGGIVGENNYANVINCHTLDGSFINGHSATGGIVGNSKGNIIGCSNAADIDIDRGKTTASRGAGGILGNTDGSHCFVVGCYNTGDIKAEDWVSGIGSGYLIGCYNVGKITATNTVFGYVGGIMDGFSYNFYSGDDLPYGDIAIGCYNLGAVEGEEESKGAAISGYFSGNNYERCVANYYGGSEGQYSINDDGNGEHTFVAAGITAFDTSDYTSAMNVMNEAINEFADLTVGDNPTYDNPVDIPLEVSKYINTWQYTTEGATAEMPLRLINTTLGIK